MTNTNEITPIEPVLDTPVAQEPVAKVETIDPVRNRATIKWPWVQNGVLPHWLNVGLGLYVAPVAAQAQPDPRTPADMFVNGGALKLALNALRRAGKNEIADELEKTAAPAQQPVSGAEGSETESVLIDGTAYQVPVAVAGELLRLHLELHAAAQPQPSGDAGELPDAVRVPLDSLHADAVYLLSRVKQETLSIHDAALSIRSRIDSARAALAAQPALNLPSAEILAAIAVQENRQQGIIDNLRRELAAQASGQDDPVLFGQCKSIIEDAERYRDWREAATTENKTFLDAAYAYEKEHFPEGRPTEAQFDAGIDAARAAAKEES